MRNCSLLEKPMRLRVHLYVAAACVAALAALPVDAALISKVEYEVLSGTFDGPNLAGPITGGTVAFTPLPPLSPGYGGIGTAFLRLSGTAGVFSATWTLAVGGGPCQFHTLDTRVKMIRAKHAKDDPAE